MMRKAAAVLIMSMILFGSVSYGLVEAKSYTTLPQAVWSQKPNADYLAVNEDIFYVPEKNTLYIHLQEEKFSATKAWSPDSLRAIDPETGKVKWAFSFAKAGYGWPSTKDPFVYAPDGTVYAYFSFEKLLYSVSPSGKENWSKQLSTDIPLNGKLYRMADGTLIIAAEKSAVSGKEAVQFIGFDKNGKQKFNKVVAGKLVTVTNGQLIVEAPAKANMQADVYNASLQRVFQHAFPKDVYVNFHTTFALADGTIVFPVSSKQKTNMLLAISPNGKTVWERKTGQQELAFPSGSGYLLLDYSAKKLSYYNQKGLVKARVLSNFTIPEGDVLPRAHTTADGKLFVDLVSRQYVFDPKTLTAIHEFDLKTSGYVLDYRNNSVFVYWKESKISKHILK
ncbi:PQQ-binding-like beta-propeller repeat protein [Paenibacillus sp. GCM10027626]|uniref:outer membrane protein assembly factor BamB family protein n=1 Tax=Paenibacillus sp. GCM10027626 TaxID=3273411 RepID=UPI00362D9F76